MARRRITFKHRLEYVALRAALAVLLRLPESVADAFCAAVGRFGFAPLGIRREQTEKNLRAAFPEQSQGWRDGVARASYEHLGREMLGIMRMSRLTRENIIARTTITNLEEGERVFGRGQGAVVVAGHFGNWELGAAMCAVRGYPMDVIAQRQANPLFDRFLVRTRERFGVEVIERSKANRQALRALRKGHAVAFAADQDAGRNGVFVSFFGQIASTHRGAALMAIRTGAPLLLAVPLRQPDRSYAMRLEIIEEFPDSNPADLDAAVEELTARFTARLEAAIRTAPGQYLWQHRRWKTRPPQV